VDTGDKSRIPTGCSCNESGSRRLFPNEEMPCEWHFVFESLARPENSRRIQVLNMDSSSTLFVQVLKFGSCRFFDSPLPQLTTLMWKDDGTRYAYRLLSDPSVTLEGRRSHPLARVNNLTTFTIKNSRWRLNAETFRRFLLNNQSLESLELYINVTGSTDGPPVDLLNLKSLCVDSRLKVLSNVIRVPAFQRLTSLRISLEDELGDLHTIRATGDGISLSAKSWALDVAEDWQHLTGYARPTIHHVRLYDRQPDKYPYCDLSTMITALMVDAYTLDIGLTYSGCQGDNFWAKLKQLGPQLKTIRFEVSEKMVPFGGLSDPESPWDDHIILDKIADLVKHRFKEDRPLVTVERMVVSEDERVNWLQDFVWRWFRSGRRIQEYLVSA
jgi:hypothetical protein